MLLWASALQLLPQRAGTGAEPGERQAIRDRQQPHNQPWSDIQATGHRKAIAMTTPVTRQPHHTLIRRAMITSGRVGGILRYLNDELLAAGDAIARSNRFPQPGPHVQAAQVMPVSLASADRILTEV